MVHGSEAYETAVAASRILFAADTAGALRALDEKTLLDVMEGVPQFVISAEELKEGIPVLELLATKSGVFPSKGEARKMIQGGGVSINKEKISDPTAVITADALLNDKYLLAQRGKKNYFLLKAE